ncbi:ABC transporter permease [Chryseolinea sp. T2]|uniref:ABC transporter permease n=1 Tax=Chryseolinea sp. T2 TaxID=3129255 RepID=UPI003077F370
MLKNFFTVAIRSFLRNKAISFIHVAGLSIGISASLLIFLIVHFENSFDKFQPDRDRIYRVVMDLNMNGVDGHSSAVPAPLANAMAEVSGVDAVVPVMTFQGDAKVNVTLTESPQKIFKEQEGTIFTTAGYFSIMPFEWIAGAPERALNEPFSVVLTESRVKLYFPGLPLEAAIGKQLNYNEEVTATITGIVRDLHETTHLNATDFISYGTISKTVLKDNFMMDNWNDWMAYSSLYVKLAERNDRAGASEQVNAIAKRFRQAESQNTLTYVLQPLSDIHFNGAYNGFNQRIASKSTLWGLVLIAAFILTLACINFTNLASAQTSLRAREIGVRKSIGSSRKLLIFQFLSETFLIALLACFLSMALTPVLLDLFSDFIPAGVLFQPLAQPEVIAFLIILITTVSLLAGIYPALVLSGIKAVSILKGNVLPSGSGSTVLRKGLIITQFMIAQVFIFGAFMVSKQVNYSLHEDLGYTKDAIVYFDVDRMAKDNREPLLNEISKLPGVSKATIGFLPPATEGAAFGRITFKNQKEEIKERVQVRWGDPEFIDVYGIDVVAGRNIRKGKDVHEVMINETYAKVIGFTDPQMAINEQLFNGETPFTIVGVMRDFHESSMRSPIGSLVFLNNDNSFFFHIALTPESTGWSSSIASIGNLYNRFYPEREFKYTFFDESIAKFYKEEQNTARLLGWAMGISILISCMGLLGLVMHTSETRTKEIGIRKILGASVSNLISILSVDFIVLVAIAFLLAAPLSWWAAHKWLEGFAYKTSISLWVFVVSGVVMIVVAVVALGFHTFKTATSNPVKSLRSE